MADFLISSLRGGLNNSDPSNAIPADQVIKADNVEWITSMLGERRRGATAVSVTGSDLVGKDRVSFLYRHLPTTDETAAQLWALGVTGTASYALCYKDTTWHTVTPTDAITITGTYQYQVQAQSLHGKLFLAHKSGQDRLHVWDGTTLRRTGLAQPAAPTGADTASAGSFTGTRYYRVRYIVKSGSTVLRRSEPSDALTFAPNGSFTGATITKPASISEDETHWELEASVDNNLFYVIATTAVGTTTVDDTTAFSPGYADAFDLSPEIGDYTLIPSGKFLLADRDRLVMLGSFEDDNLSSRVAWTPVAKATGDGNDERLELRNEPFVDLDTLEGGPITGGVAANGSILVFKRSHIYLLTSAGSTTNAYDVTPLSKARGALEGSIVEGVDQSGNPVIYFLDPNVGPCYISPGSGVRQCGADIRVTWLTINRDAATVVVRSVFYPEARQVHWWVATDSANVPNTRLVLQTNEMRQTDDGARRGWSIWTGPSAAALSVCLFAENVDDNDARSLVLRPFIALSGSGLIWRTDTGNDDNGTAYTAWIQTKPYAPVNFLHQFDVKSGTLLAAAVVSATVDVKVTRDFGLETVMVAGVTMDPAASETQVIKVLSDFAFSELRTAQVEFKDPAFPGTRWALNTFALREERNLTAT